MNFNDSYFGSSVTGDPFSTDSGMGGEDALSLTGSDSGGGVGFTPAMGIQAGGGLLGIVGNLDAGESQSNLLNRQAGLQRQYAKMALTAGNYNAYRQSILAGRQLGAERAGYGASGVDQSSGSVMAVMGASAANAELDRQNIIYGANVRAINYENQASLDEISAGNAKQAGTMGAISSGVGAIGSIAAIAAFA